MDKFLNSKNFFLKSSKHIPLGTQTFSKSIKVLPFGVSPLYSSKAKGSNIWDVDNNKYIDFCNALAAVIIGYADNEVDKAVIKQMKNGVTFSLSHTIETIVAKKIIDLVPSAQMVRFGKNGTDATSAAIRLARAYTKKNKILVCGYHGWQDWYIASTTRDLGVPNDVKKLTIKLEYNNFDDLVKKIENNKEDLAALIMEPMNSSYPKKGYLEKIRFLTEKYKIVLIFDETITGFRFSLGGAQKLFNVTPDLTTLGKGLANGYPLSVICGKKKIMELMEDIFFSGTFNGETLSLAAAEKTIDIMKNKKVLTTIKKNGYHLEREVKKLISKYALENVISITGHPTWTFLNFKDISNISKIKIKSYLMQELFDNGIFLLGTHNLSLSNNHQNIQKLLSEYDKIFFNIKKGIANNSFEKLFKGKEIEPIFKIR